MPRPSAPTARTSSEADLHLLRFQSRSAAGVFRGSPALWHCPGRARADGRLWRRERRADGIVADAALAAGGEVIGIIPRRMIARELGHAGVTSLIPVNSMHERKQKMADLADGSSHSRAGSERWKSCSRRSPGCSSASITSRSGLLNVAGFYDRLIDFLAHMQGQSFLKPQHLASLLVEDSVERLLDRFGQFKYRPLGKWMD